MLKSWIISRMIVVIFFLLKKTKKWVGEQKISSDHIIDFSEQITKKLASEIMVIHQKTYYYWL
jgi:hypothetical protein